MKPRPVAFVIGNSLLMDSLAANLVNNLGVSVVHLGASREIVEGWMKAFEPRLIVFELDTPSASTLFPLLREQAEALLFAVDLNSSQVIVLEGSHKQIENIEQFCELVKSRLFIKTRIRKGGRKLEKVDTHRVPESA